MIESYLKQTKQVISASPFVVLSNIQYFQTSPSTYYLKGQILFADGSRLAVFEHLTLTAQGLLKTDYRYHYMDRRQKQLFRYDTAKHHASLKTFPHHKHLKTDQAVVPAKPVDLVKVIKEIQAILLSKTF